MLSLMTFFPLLGAAVVLMLPEGKHRWIRFTSLIATLVPLVIGAVLFVSFDRSTAAIQFVERVPWIQPFHIDYFLGLDGLSLPMVLLTVLLSFLCILASSGISKGVKGYFAMFLLLETGMLGVFCALDFFLFFIFWEAMLLPMLLSHRYLGRAGQSLRRDQVLPLHPGRIRRHASGDAGDVFLLRAAYFRSYRLAALHPFAGKTLTLFHTDYALDKLMWIALFIGFAIKVPIWPFHTWLPWAHVEAPTAVSVILAGVLLKMGAYGILRVNFPILPEVSRWAADAMAILGVINIVYGALCAMAQKDLKKLVAYSSVSHMGYVLLGIASFSTAGVNGAVLQMFITARRRRCSSCSSEFFTIGRTTAGSSSPTGQGALAVSRRWFLFTPGSWRSPSSHPWGSRGSADLSARRSSFWAPFPRRVFRRMFSSDR